jgi:iron complex outermembrane receptor protein
MNRSVCLLPLLTFASLGLAQNIERISEKDYLTDMPVVLSVSRLSQPLDETPGAVTIIDRDMIRRSGARDVADLLRMVPGFQVSTSFESVAPLVSYHGAFDSYSNRIQLLIDGRSAYSPYFIGSIGPGLQTVALEDIDRIEVLRGSNSAAYGARAILGVINIITLHSADTLGVQAALTAGENGIRDAQARIGWGDQRGTFRLNVDQRTDDGLTGANGKNQVNRVNFRTDLNPGAGEELQVRLGGFTIAAGKGFADILDQALRPTSFNSTYAQLDYKRSLNADQDISLQLSHSQESYQDQFPYALQNRNPLYGVNDIYVVNAGGQASSDVLTLQHNLRRSEAVRLVWGGEFRSERVQSMGLYNTNSVFVTDFSRLFGNVEWRTAKNWLINAGGMFEHSSVNGDALSPRLMANWHLDSGQTLRFGVSNSARPPSTFEQFANLRFVFPYPPGYSGTFNISNIKSSGQLQPETVVSKEIGYLGEFPKWRMSLDVRAFHEQLGGFIRLLDQTPKYYANNENFSIQGLEYQAKWKPWTGALIAINQSYTEIDAKDDLSASRWAAPTLSTFISYSQNLPGNIDLTLTHQDSGTATLAGSGGANRVAMTRTDMRLSKPLRWGAKRGELALVVQNLGLPYQDFAPQFYFQRQAFVTLRLEN